MRKVLGRLFFLSLAAGAAYVLRYYLQGSAGAKKGDVQVVLDTGATVDPGPADAQEFVDIARKVLEIGEQQAR
jgi:hypothetical protein